MAEGLVQPGSTERPSIEVLFKVFAHPRRRFVLRQLVGRPLPTGTDRLAHSIAISEGFRPDESPFDRNRDAVESSLVHVHLPVLQEAGLVHWCQETECVSLSPTATPMPILSQLDDDRLQATFFGTEN